MKNTNGSTVAQTAAQHARGVSGGERWPHTVQGLYKRAALKKGCVLKKNHKVTQHTTEKHSTGLEAYKLINFKLQLAKQATVYEFLDRIELKALDLNNFVGLVLCCKIFVDPPYA